MTDKEGKHYFHEIRSENRYKWSYINYYCYSFSEGKYGIGKNIICCFFPGWWKTCDFHGQIKILFSFPKVLQPIRDPQYRKHGLFKYKGRIHSCKSVVVRPSPLLKFQVKVLANENSLDFTYFLKGPWISKIPIWSLAIFKTFCNKDVSVLLLLPSMVAIPRHFDYIAVFPVRRIRYFS